MICMLQTALNCLWRHMHYSSWQPQLKLLSLQGGVVQCSSSA